MWSMVPRHNKIWWRRPLVFPHHGFIQWHHSHYHKEQHIYKQLTTICHIHLPSMMHWWHRQPQTFMTQSKTRPNNSNWWIICMQITFIVYWHLLSWLMRAFQIFKPVFYPFFTSRFAHSVLIFLKTLLKFNLNLALIFNFL